MTHVVDFPGLGIECTVNEVAFSIGNFQVRWYGILIALGFLLGVGYAFWASKKMNVDSDRLFDAVLVGLVGPSSAPAFTTASFTTATSIGATPSRSSTSGRAALPSTGASSGPWCSAGSWPSCVS